MDNSRKLPDTVALDEQNDKLIIIDQTKLPRKLETIAISSPEEIFDAIKKLKVRGAPAIGVSAAIGYYIIAKNLAKDFSGETLKAELNKQKNYLASSRPTAVNLFWALDKMEQKADETGFENKQTLIQALLAECKQIRDDDIASCRRIGENGLKALGNARRILTHCNAGQLAAVRYGTALAPLHLGKEQGINFKVYCDETRPLLQGMRLSAFELAADGIDTTVICDNMPSILMKNHMIDAVIVGADRIAANGDTANKIGTYGVAIMARHFNIPFYVAAPVSTIDRTIADGSLIPIEERSPDEVTRPLGQQAAPDGVGAFNFAFDVTPADLIAGIITDQGLLRPPYTKAIAALDFSR